MFSIFSGSKGTFAKLVNMKTFWLLVCLILSQFTCKGQCTNDFRSLPRSNDKDVRLISQLRMQTEEEIAQIQSPKKNEVARMYRAVGRRMRAMVSAHEFILDDSLQAFVGNIVQRIVESNKLDRPPKIVLIQNSHVVNAMATADGSLVVHIGLISKLNNESQLAFTIAHEMAHIELQHVRKRIVESIEDGLYKLEEKNIRALIEEEGSAENMEALKKLWYYQGTNSRAREQEADLLGLTLMRNAGYDPFESIALLTKLDQAKLEQVNMDFMYQLDLEDYPFKDEWLRKRPTLFTRPPESIFFEMDSIIDHPDLDLRKQILREKIDGHSGNLNLQSAHMVKANLQRAAFQAIAAAYNKDAFDVCLYLALKLRSRFLHSPYLTYMIARVFSDLYERRDMPYDFHLALPNYTARYNDELRMVNEFLHNVNKEEFGELAYHFLKGKNFDAECESHYYLLWRIDNLTNRKDERKQIKTTHDEKFGKGEFGGDMFMFTKYVSKARQRKWK